MKSVFSSAARRTRLPEEAPKVGSINDIAIAGARPLYLSGSFILRKVSRSAT